MASMAMLNNQRVAGLIWSNGMELFMAHLSKIKAVSILYIGKTYEL